ncbi:MAG: Rieske (2Fe-2S) protein, partial [Planctomycetes bacterium]|nr:Rieske (2Fe-2S) protein [Planctomycetota bacterium]
MNRADEEPRTVAPDGRPDSAQPDWRREFPIDTPQDNYVARRDFTKFMVLTSFAFVVGQFWIAVQNWLRQRRGAPPVLKIAPLEQVPVGGATAFSYPEANDGCLLLRPDAQTLVAYHQKCTHLSCAVVPDLGQGCLRCPCHHGAFDVATGRVTGGPPRRPLTRV